MGKFRAALAAILPLACLAACAAPPPPAPPPLPPVAAAPEAEGCLFPNQQRMLIAELFFGRDVAGRPNVTDAEWTDFLSKTITPNFPDGLTVFDGYGQSRDPATGAIGRSPRVKVVLVAVMPGPDVPARLTAVMDGYKSRFHQRSVGLVTREECAGF
ncbi:MAG TPA: DUF3574 domain-containing protein [Stellaceae bacterium]|jgi:hypothetical protein|nr:DUF3574 domain-containing protein [Stellaceae bacterium]